MPGEHKGSKLLSSDENELIFQLLGQKCQTLATTIIELYSTEGRHGENWYYRDMGVLCLVKDHLRRSYYFRLFCPARKQLLWEHEIYNNMDYLAPTPFFHSFEAEDCITGFNFASEDEGTSLRCVLLNKFENKRQKREKWNSMHTSKSSYNNNASNRALHKNVSEMRNRRSQQNGIDVSLNSQQHFLKNKNFVSNVKKDSKKKLTKADIGDPRDFRHVSHVGWDPNKGFDYYNVEDPQLRQFLQTAGVSDTDMKDKKTLKYIYKFLDANGGIEAVKKELTAPPIPSRGRAPPRPNRAPPPAIPPYPQSAPVPPIRTVPPRTPPVSSGNNAPPIPLHNIPPPPPPLPPNILPDRPSKPPSAPIPPPPPILSPNPPPLPSDGFITDSGPDCHSALMQAIRSGKTLKPIQQVDKKPADTSREDLLHQIRQGVELRSVSPVTPAKSTILEQPGLAGALARALAERAKVIQECSDDSSDSNEEQMDDDDWSE